MTKKRIHTGYGIVLSASAVLSGLCLIGSCVSIYRSGDSPFSRASVAAAFSRIDIPVYICLALVIGGFLLDLFLFHEKPKLAADKQYETILNNLCRKLELSKCAPELVRAIEGKRKSRKAFKIISLVLLILCSVVFLSYSLIFKTYPEDANQAVLTAMPLFFGCLAVPFGFAVFTAYHKKHSMRKEIELVKQAIAEGAVAAAPKPVPAAKKETLVTVLRYSILGIALIVLIGGFLFGGTADVLAKAAAICTECVGLG